MVDYGSCSGLDRGADQSLGSFLAVLFSVMYKLCMLYSLLSEKFPKVMTMCQLQQIQRYLKLDWKYDHYLFDICFKVT